MNSIINNNNDIEIFEFFKYLSQLINMYVTGIEVKPIRVKTDMYITGFRRIGITTLEAHIKHIKPLLIKTNDYTMEMPLKENAEVEMWMDIDLLQKSMVKQALNELKNNFIKLNGFEIVNIQFKLKTELDNLCSQEETIIYEDKKLACKETIAKRKLCSMFKTKIIHWGKKNNITTTVKVTEIPIQQQPQTTPQLPPPLQIEKEKQVEEKLQPHPQPTYTDEEIAEMP